MVQGIGVDATDALEDVSWTVRGASSHPFALGMRAHGLAIDPGTITGRRFSLSD